MKSKAVIDTYKIVVGECADLPEDAYNTELELLDAAIEIAMKRARLYVMPCMWTAHKTNNVIIVQRHRRR